MTCTVSIVVTFAVVFGMVSAFLSRSGCAVTIVCGHVCYTGPAKSRTHDSSWGPAFCLQDVWVLRHWGRLPWWGGLRTPRYHGPLGCLSKRRQGGPWAPPPCGANSSGKLSRSMSGWCFGFFRFLFVLCDAVVISQGSVLCLCSFEPFTTRPVLGVCLRPSSSSSVWFVSSATFFLSSLSQALGNPKPLWFGVPLVFLHPGHALRPRPVHLPPHIPQGIAPAPVFFFFRRRSFSVWCFLVLVLSVLVVLVGVPGPGLVGFAALLLCPFLA